MRTQSKQMNKNLILLSLMLSMFAYQATSQSNILAHNSVELQEAISKAKPGDNIIMANGIWKDIQIKFYGKGTEIDLILNQEPIEIKSSETIASDWLANINYWTKLTGLAKDKGKIIYGGEQTQLRSYGLILGWVDLVKKLAGE